MTSTEQLERIAKELSEQLVLNIVLLYNGNHPGAEIIKEANKVVAAALAACAREARQAALKEAALVAERTPFRAHSRDDVEFHSGCDQTRSRIVSAILALERAVGESK